MNKEYNTLQKKYKLPNYEDLDRDFQISSMDEKDNLIRSIVRHIYDNYDFFTRLLGEIIQPDTSISSMKEASELSLQERTLILEIHRKMMHTIKGLIELNLDYSEKAAAEQIKETYNE